MSIIIYHNPRWGKSRNSVRILEENNINYEVVEYLKKPLKFDELKNILTILDLKPIDIIRKSESEYKDNNIGAIKDDNKILEAILKYPKILQRPIILNGEKGVIGRPPENILSILWISIVQKSVSHTYH